MLFLLPVTYWQFAYIKLSTDHWPTQGRQARNGEQGKRKKRNKHTAGKTGQEWGTRKEEEEGQPHSSSLARLSSSSSCGWAANFVICPICNLCHKKLQQQFSHAPMSDCVYR
jgi:hypothetical protein